MKLHCSVEVSNRLLPASNLSRKKAQRSCLIIGKQTVKNDKLYLLLQTSTNKQGTKYKVDGNVETIFTKFINEGKATIRIKDPPHDLIIQCDSIQLKSFLCILKVALLRRVHPAILEISNLNPKSFPTAPKTKIVIKKNSEYPTLQGFPKTTEELHLVGLLRKSFDRQILRLQSLKILNLSDNRISSLPKEIGCLPNLQELVVSNNQLGKGLKWAWLEQSTIANCLRLLDLSNNSLTDLPNQIGKLTNLVNLQVNQNLLTYLPQSIGNLFCLKYLDISKNMLFQLPGSIRNLKLLSLVISENKFADSQSNYQDKLGNFNLVELAAKSILKSRLPYHDDTIPLTLISYLDQANYCICGAACFENYIRKSMSIDLNNISISIKTSGQCTVTIDCFFCSMQCAHRY